MTDVMKELEDQVIAWLETPDWETSQSYLTTHPLLLTERAEQVLEGLHSAQAGELTWEMMRRHQALLQEARMQGVESAYERILGSDSETPSDSGHISRDAASLNDSGIMALQQYQIKGQIEDLNRAISYWQEAFNLVSPDSPDWSGYLNNLGIGLQVRYARSAELQDLEAVITVFQKADQSAAPDDPARSGYLNNLGTALRTRYVRSGKLADLDAALQAFQRATQSTPDDPSDWSKYLTNLGTGLRDRYEHTGDSADLEAAISAYQQALQVSPANTPDRSALLNNLGIGLRDRYIRTGELADLDAALQAFQQSIQSSPPGSPNRPTRLNNLGIGLRDRYTQTGELADLDAALQAFQQAVNGSPPAMPDRPSFLTNLGNGLRTRYECTGELADLNAALQSYQQAVQALPSDAPNQSLYLSNLSIGLRAQYERTGNMDDLEAALSLLQRAVQLTPDDSPGRFYYLSNLGIGLRTRYERTGNLADLEGAISTYQQALQGAPPDTSERAALLHNLGIGLRTRYEHTGNLADIEAAISVYQQALQATLPQAPDWPKHLTSLGNGLRARYQRTRNLTDLEAAISAYQQAVLITPLGAPDLPGHLTSLGNGLSDRFTYRGEFLDLEAAISAYQHALQAALPDTPERSVLLNNLGTGLCARYDLTKELADLEAALQAYQQAIQATLPDAPFQRLYLSNLGAGLHARYQRTGNLGDLDVAIAAYESSWSAQRLHFAALPVDYQLGQQHHEAVVATALVEAHLEAARRHSDVTGSRRRGLEIAEGSKSRLLTQLVGRGPLPLPVGFAPAVAERERQLLGELTAIDTLELASYGYERLALDETDYLPRLQRRRSLLGELENLWVRIARSGPEGAEYVAMRRAAAPTWQDLVRLAKTLGPGTALLSFFTTAHSLFLFVVRAGWHGPRVIEVPMDQEGWYHLLASFFCEVYLHLPGPRVDKIAPPEGWLDQTQRFFGKVDRTPPDNSLGEAWFTLLLPLLKRAEKHLAGTERLIVSPAGNGHLLPWAVLAEHANWRTPAGKSMPLVTLPALGVLPRLRRRPPVSTDLTLVVGNPLGDLPHAEEEARAVAERFETTPLLGREATKEAILPRLARASLIHLATHAFFDSAFPLESGIVLADGVLTAREILQQRLQADLLVLSACESGQVGFLGGEELAGLSQAFLQAGVRSLLVSLWRVNDSATSALMLAFYTARQAGGDKAVALRQAMTAIQQDPRWRHPYYWGAFVLMGDWN